jgi:nucleoside-diphosphate-sugar epimerase
MHEEPGDPMSKFRYVNVDGTVNLAKMAALNGVNRFIFVSSIKVNGDKTDEIPFSSLDVPQPKGPYAVSKAEAEIELQEIARKNKFDLVIVRPPLVYGPGVGGNFLRLLKSISKGVPLPLGSIKNDRSMVSITNLCSFIALCIRHPGVCGKTFLVSDNASLSTPNLIKLLASGMGCKSRIFPFPIIALKVIGKLIRKENTIDRLVNSLTIDTGDIVGSLGWKPPQTVEDGILEVAQWYRTTSSGRSLQK